MELGITTIEKMNYSQLSFLINEIPEYESCKGLSKSDSMLKMISDMKINLIYSEAYDNWVASSGHSRHDSITIIDRDPCLAVGKVYLQLYYEGQYKFIVPSILKN